MKTTGIIPNSELGQSYPALVKSKHTSSHCCMPLQKTVLNSYLNCTFSLWTFLLNLIVSLSIKCWVKMLSSIIIRYLIRTITYTNLWSVAENDHLIGGQDMIFCKGNTKMSQKKIGCPQTANYGKKKLSWKRLSLSTTKLQFHRNQLIHSVFRGVSCARRISHFLWIVLYMLRGCLNCIMTYLYGSQPLFPGL